MGYQCHGQCTCREEAEQTCFNSGKGFSSSLGRGSTISRAAEVSLGLPGSEGESQGGTEKEKQAQIWEGRECGWKVNTMKEQRAAL